MKLVWMLITDVDKNTFALHGPMADDTEWVERVVAAQALGPEGGVRHHASSRSNP